MSIHITTVLRGPEAAEKLLNLTWGDAPLPHRRANRYGCIALPRRDEETGKLEFGYSADLFIKLGSSQSLAIESDATGDVYFVPSVLKSQANRRRDNCAGSGVAWLDYDAPTTIGDLLELLPLPPTAVVQSSPHKYHAYWKLDVFIPNVETVQFINAQVLYNTPGALDADASGYDATQLLRLPMGINAKQDYDEPFRPALVVYDPSRVYGLEDFQDLPHTAPNEAWEIRTIASTVGELGDARPLTELSRFPDYAVRKCATLLQNGVPDGKRGRAVYQIVGTLHASGFDLEDIVNWIAASPLSARYDGSETRMIEDIERIWDRHATSSGNRGDDGNRGDGNGSDRSGDGSQERDRQEAPPEDRFAKFKARAYSSTRLEQIPQLDPLIDDLLYLNSICRVFGESTAGKSFAAIDMCGCIGTGMRYHGLNVTQANVLYICAEGEQGIRKRVRLWEQHWKREMENVTFFPEAFQIHPQQEEWADFLDWCEEENFRLVVLDTQARVTLGQDENSNTEMSLFVDALDDLRKRTGACIMPIHHTGTQDQERARGASVVRAALQTEIVVQRDKKAGVVTIKPTKQKDDEEVIIPLLWSVEAIEGEFKRNGKPVKSVILLDSPVRIGQTDDDDTDVGLVVETFRPLSGWHTWSSLDLLKRSHLLQMPVSASAARDALSTR